MLYLDKWPKQPSLLKMREKKITIRKLRTPFTHPHDMEVDINVVNI